MTSITSRATVWNVFYLVCIRIELVFYLVHIDCAVHFGFALLCFEEHLLLDKVVCQFADEDTNNRHANASTQASSFIVSLLGTRSHSQEQNFVDRGRERAEI